MAGLDLLGWRSAALDMNQSFQVSLGLSICVFAAELPEEIN
jgi:hypothetical protein